MPGLLLSVGFLSISLVLALGPIECVQVKTLRLAGTGRLPRLVQRPPPEGLTDRNARYQLSLREGWGSSRLSSRERFSHGARGRRVSYGHQQSHRRAGTGRRQDADDRG